MLQDKYLFVYVRYSFVKPFNDRVYNIQLEFLNNGNKKMQNDYKNIGRVFFKKK
jgi:hypothetical protein